MSFDRLRGALASLNGKVLAVDERRFAVLDTMVGALVTGQGISDSGLAALGSSSQTPRGRATTPLAIAVIPMIGTALYDVEFPPFAFSTRKFAHEVSAVAADSAVQSIVIYIDTPGGEVTGTEEAADAVWAARQRKPVIGIIDPLCASAGYWIGSQCTKLISVPSGEVGSIGVRMCHIDQSAMLQRIGIKPTHIYAGKNKVEGNPHEPLGDASKAYLQTEIYKTYDSFLSTVARGRRTHVDIIAASWGQGRIFGARDALRLGMIDRIEPSPAAALTFAASTMRQRTAELMRAKLAILGA